MEVVSGEAKRCHLSSAASVISRYTVAATSAVFSISDPPEFMNRPVMPAVFVSVPFTVRPFPVFIVNAASALIVRS